MTGLFLRYCWRCNTTSPMATPKGTCSGCGEKADAVDAHVLLSLLGRKLDEDQRKAALAAALDKSQD